MGTNGKRIGGGYTEKTMKSKIYWMLIVVMIAVMNGWAYGQSMVAGPPTIKNLKFGSVEINGTLYDHDVLIENGEVKKRKNGPSKPLREKYGHTPLTPLENIPWDCDTLVIGIGMSGRLPIVDDFKKEAAAKGVTLIFLETPKAVEYFIAHFGPRTNAIFHITC
jgi:hypothetical protein